ncbi:hypothetical protein ACMXYN_12755 [Neptuniibacter sp. PT8_73]|uniref:hypothetical protein n=1 Tax=unclassified Neptuniibacter TaxID=2630693 RepID=UPI0039F69061
MAKARSLSVLIASILSLAPLVSAANTQNEDPKDSVNSWGKWAQNYSTAAGGEFNPGTLAFASIQQNEAGRNFQNEPNVIFNEPNLKVAESVLTCSAGSACGFSADVHWRHEGEEIILGDRGVGIITWEVTGEELPDFMVGNSFGVSPEDYNTKGHFLMKGTQGSEFKGEDIKLSISAPNSWLYFHSGNKGEPGTAGAVLSLKTYGDDSENTGLLRSGRWQAWMNMENDDDVGADGDIYGGITTSLPQLNDFVSNLNGPTAQYSGFTYDEAEFDIAINFSKKSWSGSFGESDKGGDSFKVKGGALTGVAFTAKSRQLSSATGTVSGQVSGALFGDKAQSVAGLIDIKKNGVDRKTIFQSELTD